MSFHGEFTAPAFRPVNVTVKAPFTFEGLVIPPSNLPDPSTQLVGNGTATVRLTWLEGAWKLQRVDYLFGSTLPIPEPATLLLVGPAALAGLMFRRRRTTLG